MSATGDSLPEGKVRADYYAATERAGQLLAAWRSQATHEGQPLTERAA